MIERTRDGMPVDYPPDSYCTSCGRDFSGNELFDRHRVGVHDYTLIEGLRMEPPREDGRRCLDPEEMEERGWHLMTDKEKLASARHRRRAGFGVELWIDPARQERAKTIFPRPG